MSIFGKNRAPVRRLLTTLSLSATLLVTALFVSQCRMVGDSVTGVDLSSAPTLSARNGCQRKCEERYKAAKRAEERRHQQAVRACLHDRSCRNKEDELHKQNERRIREERRACKRGCYNEGVGDAGR